MSAAAGDDGLDGVYDKEGMLNYLKERFPLKGFQARERESKFEFIALGEEWEKNQQLLLKMLQQIFQFDKRLEQLKFKLMRSPQFNPTKLPGEWGFYPVPNPQGLHVTILSGVTELGSSTKPQKMGKKGHAAVPLSTTVQIMSKEPTTFEIIQVRGVSDGRTEPFAFDSSLWCVRRYVLTVKIHDVRIETEKPAHISIGCFGFKLT